MCGVVEKQTSLNDSNLSVCKLLTSTVDVLESINLAVTPLLEFTDALSGESYVSVSYLKPVLHLFNTEVMKPNDGETELTQTIKMIVSDYLNEKYDDLATDCLLDIASLIDPRFKTLHQRGEYGPHKSKSCLRDGQ